MRQKMGDVAKVWFFGANVAEKRDGSHDSD